MIPRFEPEVLSERSNCCIRREPGQDRHDQGVVLAAIGLPIFVDLHWIPLLQHGSGLGLLVGVTRRAVVVFRRQHFRVFHERDANGSRPEANPSGPFSRHLDTGTAGINSGSGGAGACSLVRSSTSSGMRPRETQLRSSAQTSTGGRMMSALRSATVMFNATTRPKSRSRGREDVAMTATPAMAVSADTMNARPVWDAVTFIASRGERPRRRSST